MRNPWLILACCIAVFVLSFILDRVPEPLRSSIRQSYADKFFHFAAGYLLMAFGGAFLGIRDKGVLFLFAAAIGAGWEVMQYLTYHKGFVLHEEPYVLGGLEPFADLAATLAGAFIYWLLHLRITF